MRIDQDGTVIKKEQYKAVLIGVACNEDIEHSMEELEALADSAGVTVIAHMVQNSKVPHPRTYFGKGKLEELANMCVNMEVDTVIVNDELSPSQARHLEDSLDARVIDRTMLILDIFATRADSKEGKLQVELAQLQYRLPRLKGLGKALSKLAGGIGTRGPGEKKLESDRRHILRRMDDLKSGIEEVKVHRETQRGSRRKSDLPLVALVGYTNAGKSATMNAMLGRHSVMEEDKLFATLDTAGRRIKLDTNEEFILVDTVGFVSKLPHDLVEAFKATLEDVKEADLILHIVDSSYEGFGFHIDVVDSVMKELGADENEQLMVYNKIDIEHKSPADGIGISAKTGENLDVLFAEVRDKLFGNNVSVKLLIPFDKGELSSYLFHNRHVLSKEFGEDGVVIEVELNDEDLSKYSGYRI